MSVFDDIQRLHTRTEQVAENSAREMFEVITVESTGVGQSVLTNPVRFHGPFVRRPAVMYGSDVVRGVDPEYWAIPLCTGSVFRYERDERGFYVGVHLALRVETRSIKSGGPEVNPLVRHSFTFLGVSFKHIESSLAGELDVRQVEL